MKLNIDCVRDVLLELEKLPLGKVAFVSTLSKVLDYPESDILYSCVKLQEAGYIITADIYRDCNYMPHIAGIIDITFQGHEFLEKIRSDSIWNNNVKPILSSIGTKSFDAIIQISSNVISSLISGKLALNS